MARKADGRGKVRAELEGVLLVLADIEDSVPMVSLRIHQAIRRGGLDAVLVPALCEIERVVKDVIDARTQVLSAVERLME